MDLEITKRKVKPSEMTVERGLAANPKYNPGRREEIKYRDTGLERATQGDVRAEVMEVAKGVSRPTGWHYHTCDVQFLHMIKGWVKLELPNEGAMILEAGDSITIPGGMIHQELSSSDNMELLEVTIPAKMGTVAVDKPDWATEDASDYGDEISHAIKAGHAADT